MERSHRTLAGQEHLSWTRTPDLLISNMIETRIPPTHEHLSHLIIRTTDVVPSCCCSCCISLGTNYHDAAAMSCLRVLELDIKWRSIGRRLSCWFVVITVSKMSWWIAATWDFTSHLARLRATNRLCNFMIYYSNCFLRLPGPSKIHAESCFGALPFCGHRNCKSRVFRHVRYVYAWRQEWEKTDLATNTEHLVSFQRLCANQHEHLPSNFKNGRCDISREAVYPFKCCHILDLASWLETFWKSWLWLLHNSGGSHGIA